MALEPNVTVLDEESRFLEYTHPAVARKLLKEGSATIWTREPFAIKLKKVVKQPNYQVRNDMLNVSQLTAYFKEEKDIYVQNISDAQVSVAFEVATGHVESHLFANTRDPVCLSTYLPFNVIKNSMDFRKMLIRRPAALVLLTEEEYKAYYSKRASSLGLFIKDGGKKVPDTDEAIRRAEDDRQGVLRRDVLPDAEEPRPIRDIKSESDEADDFAPGQLAGKEIHVEDLVNPRILNLCNQVNPGLTDQQKMPASAILSELQKMADGLKVADWEHVTHHGHYKSVKNFAKKALSALAAQD